MYRVAILIPFKGSKEDIKSRPCSNVVEDLINWKNPNFNFSLFIQHGTNLLLNRNRLVAKEDVYDSKNSYLKWEIKNFDLFLWVDDDIFATKEDFMVLFNHYKNGKLNVGLPYIMRRSKDKYTSISGGYRYDTKARGCRPVDMQGLGFRLQCTSIYKNLPPEPFNQITIQKNGRTLTMYDDASFDYICNQAGIVSWCDFNNPVEHRWQTKNQGVKMPTEKTQPQQQTVSVDRMIRVALDKLNSAQRSSSEAGSIISQIGDALTQALEQNTSLQEKLKNAEDEIQKLKEKKVSK